jgi:hypothetical protein
MTTSKQKYRKWDYGKHQIDWQPPFICHPQFSGSIYGDWHTQFFMWQLVYNLAQDSLPYHLSECCATDHIIYIYILYLKFKLSNEKQHLYHVIVWFFMVFHSNSWFCNPAWDTIIFHGRSTVGYYSIPRATRGHHALKQYGVRELLFVLLISYRTIR